MGLKEIIEAARDAYDKERNRDKYERLERQSAENIRAADQRARFFASPDFDLVRQFTIRYSTRASNDDMSRLRDLLSSKQWYFSFDEILFFISDEIKRQQAESLIRRIESLNPRTIHDFIRAYIEINGSDAKNLPVLENLLRARGLFQNREQLEHDLFTVNRQLELQVFESRLRADQGRISIEDIDLLGGYEFEDLLRKLFANAGYHVLQTKLSGDQGADLVLQKFGETTVIQAKRYGGKVGNSAVQEIVAAMSMYRAQHGMVVTNNYFTRSAVELAQVNKIELIDRPKLSELISKFF